MYRTVFELIMKHPSSDRQIDDRLVSTVIVIVQHLELCYSRQYTH